MYPPSPLMNAGKCRVMFIFFSTKREKNHLIINIVSEGREELAWCPKFFV